MGTKIISYISFAFLAIQIVLSIIIVAIDKTIPIHWNIYGEIDTYGDAYNILIVTFLNILSYILLHWLSMHPEVCNFPRPFKDKDVAFSNMSALLKWVELYVAALMLYITIGTLCNNLWIPVIYLLIIGLIYTTIAGIIRLSRS